MKKQFHALALSAALLISPLMHASKDTFKPELGASSLGAVMITTGLYLISKSGGKKGNPAKGLLGLLFTIGGGYAILKGPGYVRYKNSSETKKTFAFLGFSNKSEEAKIKHMQNFADQKANSEDDAWKKQGYNFISTLLTYLPSDAVPIPDHLS